MSETTQVQKGHPKGLYVLFTTEMWERFSYYGNRWLLVLFMTKYLLYDKGASSLIYGNYNTLVYLMPLLGGYIADRYWGNRKSILAGAALMAIGQFIMFASGSFHGNMDMARPLFFVGILFLVVGNGFFKPNISSMVGQLYKEGDKRKDAAYTIFYMGINVGALIGPLVTGGFAETGNVEDFRWVFLISGLGMIMGAVIFQLFKNRYIVTPDGEPVGLFPNKKRQVEGEPILAKTPLTKVEKERIAVIFIVAFFVIFFWSAFEQAGSSLTFFADEQTNRSLFGWTVPTAWFQSVNSFFVITCAPLFAMLWTYLGKKNAEPSSPTKMAIGLFLLAVGYAIIAIGVKDVTPGVKTSMFWIVTMYAFHTFGELSLSPIGLSLVNKLSPARLASLMMAVWFLSNAAAGQLIGVLGALYPASEPEFKKAGEAGINLPEILTGKVAATTEQIAKLKELGLPSHYPSLLGIQITNLYEFFMVFVVMAGIASIILFLLSRKLQKMMNGIQ